MAIVLLLLLRLAFVSTQTTDVTTLESCVLNETCWDENVTTTEMPLNVTETIEINVTTVAPATEMPQIKEETLQQTTQKGCFCNLQRDFCDINCCCDGDCNYENKLAFSHCRPEENRYVDTRFCDYIEFIYKNNTLYEWEVNQNGFFCIVKQNLPAQYTLQQKTEIKDLEDATLQMSNKYLWPTENNEKFDSQVINLSEKFVHGKSLLLVKNNVTLQKFQLPVAFLTNMCGNSEEIKFLENFKSRCAHFGKSEALKPETYFKNLTLISIALRLKNISKAPDFHSCPRNVCIKFNVFNCDEDFENCGNFSTKNLTMLAKKIKYNIYHNGTKGIKKVDLFIVLEDANKFNENSGFYQDFQVNFYWTNYTLNYSSILSGNPGYKDESSILIGSLIKMFNVTKITGTNLTETRTYYKIERKFDDVAKNFLVFPISYNEESFCKLNNNTHNKVEFGYNSIFKCRFVGVVKIANKTASIVCKNLQKQIFDRWSVIYNGNITKVVGRFGNANPNNIGEWVRILQNKPPEKILNNTSGFFKNANATIVCNKIVNKISVTIFHSRVDTKYYNNQEKIVGILFKYGGGENFEFALQEGRFEIPTHVDVIFVDTTKPKVKKFVDPPTFKIRLPYDFFYPFIKVPNNHANCVKINSLILFIVFVINFL